MSALRLLLHGFLGAPADWERVCRTLPPAFDVLCPVLPGHGDSEGALPDLFEWVDAQRRAMPGGRYHLAGYSLGGRIALAWALRYPQEIETLCLLSASPGIEVEADRAVRRARDEDWSARLRHADRATFLSAWYAQPVFLSLGGKPEILRSLMARRAMTDLGRLADILLQLSPGVLRSHWADLGCLDLPVLWVAGAEDPVYADISRRAAGLCPRGEVRIVPGSGHALHEEQPDAVADLLDEWWRRNA